MIEIDADMESIITQALLLFVATVNEDGTSEISPNVSLSVIEKTLYFLNVTSSRTMLNLRLNPTVQIDVIDIFRQRGYQFKGRASVLSSSEDEYLIIRDLVWSVKGADHPIDNILKIDTASVEKLSLNKGGIIKFQEN